MNTPKILPILIICVTAILLRVWFTTYTHYTAEDAHITYQFSRNVSEGNGFALNKGEPIYGSTTPLLTLLLAGWYRISSNLVLGSKIIALLSCAGGLWFLYFSIQGKREAIIVTVLLAVSMKLIAEEMQGMEMPLIFLFMVGAWYGYIHGMPLLSGIMCGLLLWTRVDCIVFVGCIFIFHLLQWRTAPLFILGTLVYLPWLIFSHYYFGSIIPFTITAKAVAYGIGNPPFTTHLIRIAQYVSYPICASALIGMFFLRGRELFFPLLLVASVFVLALKGMTFFDRYFYTVTITALIITGIAIAKIPYPLLRNMAILGAIVFTYNFSKPISYYKDMQAKRHTLLTEMGLWINENTPDDATVLLEPLGYVGYYAQRRMLDQVGLVTPEVVDLYKQGVKGHEMYTYLHPDYVIMSCGEYNKVMDDFSLYYEKIQSFQANYVKSCYEIWEKK